MTRSGPLRFWEELWRSHGDLAAVRFGPVRATLVVNPHHVEQVLVKRSDAFVKGLGYRDLKSLLGQGLITSENPLWRKQRHALQPAFTPTAVTGFDEILFDAGRRLVRRWHDSATRKASVDLSAEMIEFAMGTAGRAIFDVDLQDKRLDVADAFDDCFSFMSAKTSNPYSPPLFVPTPANRDFKRKRAVIDRFIDGIIASSDMMDRPNWVFARLLGNGHGADIDRRQVRDEIITLFFAGYETSARARTWTIILLLQHPAIAERFQAEIDDVIDDDPEAEFDVDKLEFARAIVHESLRLYPPAPIIARQNQEEVELDGCVIPSGSLVVLAPYLTQRHEEFWSDPEAFQPERFLGQTAAGRPRCAYFPFGAGARICIGQHLAMREVMIALALMFRTFKVRRVGNGPIDPQFNGTMKPEQDIPIEVRERAARSG